jgi:uncharacterized protein YyaL (SSP411 family)
MNRLSSSRSSYLLQHKDNPVHWWEWGPAASAEAVRTDRPILLSVGYAACHWCHVMAHESFEDPAVAAVMNENFVCVKVDRQERPDVDAVYMQATLAMTGSGGWPMTCFLTPAGEPFHCGTYYPPTSRGGHPGFVDLLTAVANTWRQRRSEVDDAAARMTSELRRVAGGLSTTADDGADDTAVVDAAVATAISGLEQDEDRRYGGLGGAPKFPPSTVLELLSRAGRRYPAARELADRTLVAMARSGMADQLGGGFARYSVDAAWVVPHFEKMLYDNALLLRCYALAGADASSAHGDEFARVGRGAARFLLADLATSNGLFSAALDADTDGVEGATYVWTPAQLVEVLGDDDGRWAAELFAVTDLGTFEHGTSTLQLTRPVDDDPETLARFEWVRAALLEARGGRPQPGRDELVVAGWNGLAISALATGGAVLGEPSWIAAATVAARALVAVHEVAPGVLVRPSREGVPGIARGVLEDYAYATVGMLDLFAVTGDAFAAEAAQRWISAIRTRFCTPDGDLRDTDVDADVLVVEQSELTDNATPAARSVAADALLRWAALTGSSDGVDIALRALRPALELAERAPRAVGWGLAAAYSALGGPVEVAVIGAADDPRTRALVGAAVARAGTAVAVGPAAADGSAVTSPTVPLLAERGLVDGAPTAYVCRGFVCDRPVTTVEELAALLDR